MAVKILINQWNAVTNLILQRGKDQSDQQWTEIQLGASVFEKETRQISRLYDSILRIVFLADHFFGHIVILSNSLSIFAICGFVPILVKIPFNEHPLSSRKLLPFSFFVSYGSS